MLHEYVYVYISIFIMWVYNNTLVAYLQGVRVPSPNEYPEFDTKMYQAPVWELWEMCHYYQVQSDPEWYYLLESHLSTGAFSTTTTTTDKSLH